MAERIGKYEIVDRIGRGGMGTIYKARDPMLNRLVAVKVISNEIDVTDELRARFFREAQACARLSHPNIVTVHDMGEDDGRLFLVMELLEGDDLRRVIREGPALELEDKLSIMLQVCEGLDYAHRRGVIHRDIKPGNIMRLRGGPVKILDFGIAHVADDDGTLTRTGHILGTLRYLAPEQLSGRADHRSDIFSVGAVFYELVSGRSPFTGETPVEIMEQVRTSEPPPLQRLDATVPPQLSAAVERAMQKAPSARFADLAELRGQLEPVLRTLNAEGEALRAQVRAQRDELLALQQTLAERAGAPREEPAIAEVGEHEPRSAVREIERQLAGRIESVRADIARAEEAERAAATLLRRARAALTDGGTALCISLLDQLAAPPPSMRSDIASLRAAAELQLAEQETARSTREGAEAARDQMIRARWAAQAWVAARHASTIWREAEAGAATGREALAREAYDEARRAFDEATALYRRSETSVREAFATLAPDDRMSDAATAETPATPAPVSDHATTPVLARDERPSRRRFAVPAAAALGGLLVIAIGVMVWRSTPSPPTPTPTPVTSLTSAPSAGLPVATLPEPVKDGKRGEGADMVLIPAGAFRMGSDPPEVQRAIGNCKRDRRAYPEARCKDWFEPEAPDHRVVLDAFYIDRFEVTNALFGRFVGATTHETTAQRAGYGFVYVPNTGEFVKSEGADWRKPNGFATSYLEDHPVVQVSWHDADAYCRWAGKRLPTEAEWEKAARGDDRRWYPWGSSWEDSRANARMSVRTTTAVGSYPSGVSPFGVHDMAGNAWEWVADWFDPNYYKRSPERNPRGPDSGSSRVARGGAWTSGATWARVSFRPHFRPDARQENLGFRCAKDG